MEKQLNVWINGDLKDWLTKRTQDEKKTLKEVIDDILQREAARQSEEMIEQRALPLLHSSIQHIIHTELQKSVLYLEQTLQTYIESEFDSIQDDLKQSHDRLASLLVRTVRDGGVNRRLTYALLAKMYGPEFAQDAYSNASEKAQKELATRVQSRMQAVKETR